MSYQIKFYISAIILGLGCLLVLWGFTEAQGGGTDATFKLGAGVLLVAIGGSAFKYFRYRKNIPKSQAEIDIETKVVLQDKKEKN